MPPNKPVMSGVASLPSPRSSKSTEFSAHSPTSQLRPHPGPTPAQPMYSLTPSTIPSAPLPSSEGRMSKRSSPSGSPAGYFGLVMDPNDSLQSQHSRRNWSPASSSIRSAAARSPRPVLVDNPSTPFQKQAEVLGLALTRSNLAPPAKKVDGEDGRLHAKPRLAAQLSRDTDVSSGGAGPTTLQPPDYFSGNRSASPAPMDTSESTLDSWTSISVPTSLQSAPKLTLPRKFNLEVKGNARSSTLPNPPKDGQPVAITPTYLEELLDRGTESSLLLLDVRTYKLYAETRIRTAVNLCIPTTLLKRPSFNVTKLSETFANDRDKEKFGKWKNMKFIVVYDADSKDPGESSALTALHTLSKFSREGWKGQAYILKGGFQEFSRQFPDSIDRSSLGPPASPKTLSLSGSAGGAEKVAGGVFICPLPAQQSVVNPFFSNIRQNMDLIDGVGEIPIHVPQTMGSEDVAALPAWLREVCGENGSKIVADKFLHIEKAEQRRMQDALNISVTYSPRSIKPKTHTLAGVEKGTKNRYNNIWPYDHARVKLQDFPVEECDYVNASHLSIHHSHRRYIASQAPLPSTFRDFWSMVWEQDVRVIVMLTAEQEGGQIKSHKYWEADTYGQLKLTRIQERKVSLEPSSLRASPKRRSVSTSSQPSSTDPNVPHVIVRRFTLEHVDRPFSPIREITQLQYASWPDFGTPAHPTHVLGLIEHMESVVRSSHGLSNSQFSSDNSPSRRPVLVHCSAGCGRTGTFCTTDSVIGMMRRQRIQHKRQVQDDGSDGDGNLKMKKLDLDDEDNDWLHHDDEDLVFEAVCELRDQRISMVQSLQQYVLCYETILEWYAKQTPLDSGKRKA